MCVSLDTFSVIKKRKKGKRIYFNATGSEAKEHRGGEREKNCFENKAKKKENPNGIRQNISQIFLEFSYESRYNLDSKTRNGCQGQTECIRDFE